MEERQTRNQPEEVTEAISVTWHHISSGRNRKSSVRTLKGKPGHPSLLSTDYDARKDTGVWAAR